MNDTVANAAAEPPTGRPVHHASNLVVLTRDGRVLLAQRDRAPFLGSWGLPGGVCKPGEATLAVALRRCREKTGVEVRVSDVVPVSSRDEGADEAGRYVTDSFVVVLDAPVPAAAGDQVRAVRWMTLAEAFAEAMPWDHADILREAIAVAGLAGF